MSASDVVVARIEKYAFLGASIKSRSRPTGRFSDFRDAVSNFKSIFMAQATGNLILFGWILNFAMGGFKDVRSGFTCKVSHTGTIGIYKLRWLRSTNSTLYCKAGETIAKNPNRTPIHFISAALAHLTRQGTLYMIGPS